MRYSLVHQQHQFLPLHLDQELQQGLDFAGESVRRV
jgi:hypothetical protein